MPATWSGIFPAAITHFRDDQSLDLPAMVKHLDVMIGAGVHGLILLGTVGENCSLEYAEKLEVIRAVVGHLRGRVPVLSGLCAATVWEMLLPLPGSVAPLFGLVVVADVLFGVSYPPAGAMISDGAEHVGLGQAYGFGLFNLAWAGGQVIGGAGSAGLAQATADAVPYSVLAALCLLTVVAVVRQRRTLKAASAG